MGWAQLNFAFDDHPKVLALLDMENAAAAIGLWTLSLTWASRHRHPRRVAHVTDDAVVELVGELGSGLADALVRAGLWVRCDDGWLFSEPELFEWGPMDGRRSYIPRWLRRRIYRRDGWQCVQCGRADDLTLDHIWPWSLGGTDTEDNLRTLCRSCNSSKGARV